MAKSKYPYFAFVRQGDDRLAVAVEATSLQDAWYAVGMHVKPGMFVSSIVRLWKKDPRTAGWMKKYASLCMFSN